MKTAMAIAGAVLVIVISVLAGAFDPVRAILFGWAQFLGRVLPRIAWERNAVVLGLVTFALFTLGVHLAGRRWFRARPANRPWKAGWSLAASAAVVVAFAAGICLIGVTHQSAWLLRADEPMMIQKEMPRYLSGSSANNLRALSIGLHNFLSMYNDRPPGVAHSGESPPHGWAIQALIGYSYSPRLESGERIDFDRPWNDPVNRKCFRGTVPQLINPGLRTAPVRDADGYGLAHYAMNCRVMVDGIMLPPDKIRDGSANTLLLGEVNANFRPWGDPGNVRDPARGINRSPYGFGGPAGSGGALFSTADGAVHFISDRVSPAVLKALATPDGGEEIDPGVLRAP
ncbi:MAG TPA: DUF1559 domain-containing protein [Gemmataceae bacterium]|jgi:hypothetical protein|nr:DUF1559 domain-containing protein [Gemmataceae bacterium]